MKKILATLLALSVCVFMFACGKDAQTTEEVTTEATVTEAVTTAAATDETGTIDEVVAAIDTVLSTMKNGTLEEYVALTGMSIDNADPMTVAMVDAMFKKFDYSLGQATQVDDTHATVDASITSLDIMGALMSYMTVAAAAEDPETFDADGSVFMSMLTADDAATTTAEIKINLEKVDGAWALSDDNADFTAALSGGLAE